MDEDVRHMLMLYGTNAVCKSVLALTLLRSMFAQQNESHNACEAGRPPVMVSNMTLISCLDVH